MRLKSGVQFFILFVALAVSIFDSQEPCFANEESIKAEIAKLKERITELEEKLSRTDEKTKGLEGIKEVFKDFSIGAGATFVVQGTHNANGDDLSEQGEDVMDGSYSIDLEFEKKFNDYGLAFIHVETGDGAGVEDELKVFSNVNRDADDSDNSVSLTEAWYQHYFKSVPVSIMAGKIDGTVIIDSNEYANDECTQFLGRMFRNSPTIELPDNSAGAWINLAPAEFAEFDIVWMEADGDWEDIANDPFFATQVNFKPNLLNRPGNYRLYGWINASEHTKWNNISKTQEEGYGFGISFDQELTDIFGIFARYGWQDPDVYKNGSDFSLEHAYSIGLQVKGTPWGRDEDILACAFGQIFPSDEYKKINNVKAKSEERLEVYYNLKVNDHLTLSPDLQVIWDPYGSDVMNGNKTIIVGGLRGQVDF